MENCGNPNAAGNATEDSLAACSACAGDYEDPDRTAGTAAEADKGGDEHYAEGFADTKSGEASEVRRADGIETLR